MQVSEVVPDFASAFHFEEFNAMQRKAVPAVLDSNENVAASAPTGSGKTAIAELAICKTIREGGTALYIAPLRALTNELEREWNRFEDLGHSVYVVTGERDLNVRLATRADVLVMTPEKLDSLTRKHTSPRYGFASDIDCCIVDEIHLLDSDTRGSALEVTISRLRRLCNPRFVVLSATMTNVGDIAEWLDVPPENTFSFDDQYRPVELHTGVKHYSQGENVFADKYRRLYLALDLVEPHLRDDGQGLVFVASRQDTVQSARKARSDLADRGLSVGNRGEFGFHGETRVLSNELLRDLVLDGVAFHHAGLSRSDKDAVERWFRTGKISVLFSTSTLAWGVNLPARCVVIRDTTRHDPLDGETAMNPLDILQMIGRAGRPDYDDVGYGWVICEPGETEQYHRLLKNGKPIESGLETDLDRHLAAEIALGTVQDMADAVEWIDTTFYAVRARNPAGDGLRDLQSRVRESVSSLIDRGFITSTAEDGLRATSLGQLTAKFYLRLETATRFFEFTRNEDPSEREVIQTIACSAEFESMRPRRDEAAAIRDVLGDPASDQTSVARKVMAVLLATMNNHVPKSLLDDAWAIQQNSQRLMTALSAFCDRFGDPWQMNRVRRAEARLKHEVSVDAVGLVAIDGVGDARALQLADTGITTPGEIRDSGIRGLRQAGLSEKAAITVYEHACALPTVEIDWGSFPERIKRGQSELHEILIRSEQGSAHVGIRVSVNDVAMTTKTAFLDDPIRVPVGVFGTDTVLTFRVDVTFPRLPLHPSSDQRSVSVT